HPAGAPERFDRGVEVVRLPRRDPGVEGRHPHVAAPDVDVALAVGLQLLRLRERRVDPLPVVSHDVIAGEVVPRCGILLLPPGRQRLGQHPLRVAQIFLLLILELAHRRALQIPHALVDEGVVRFQVAFRFRPAVRRLLLLLSRQRDRNDGEQDSRKSTQRSHVHSLDFAIRASASRSTARATSSRGRPSACAAANTSSYSGFTRTVPPSSTFTRTATPSSRTLSWCRGSVARSATQRRTPAVVLCRNSSAVP